MDKMHEWHGRAITAIAFPDIVSIPFGDEWSLFGSSFVVLILHQQQLLTYTWCRVICRSARILSKNEIKLKEFFSQCSCSGYYFLSITLLLCWQPPLTRCHGRFLCLLVLARLVAMKATNQLGSHPANNQGVCSASGAGEKGSAAQDQLWVWNSAYSTIFTVDNETNWSEWSGDWWGRVLGTRVNGRKPRRKKTPFHLNIYRCSGHTPHAAILIELHPLFRFTRKTVEFWSQYALEVTVEIWRLGDSYCHF